MKKIIAFCLVVILLFSVVLVIGYLPLKEQNTGENTVQQSVLPAETSKLAPVFLKDISADEKNQLEKLKNILADDAKVLIKSGEDTVDCYNGSYSSEDKFNNYPAKYDLRDLNVVTSVKSQDPWGTCWAFGTLGAIESTILLKLGLTSDEYEKIYGESLDLSEKHLSWFTANGLPSLESYADDKYPYDKSQSGEGSHSLPGSSKYDLGGNFILSSSVIASGVGPVPEKDFPYTDANGGLDSRGDWSIPEENRFLLSYNLIDANVLPSPSGIDDKGEYRFNELGILAIKHELTAGRGVSVCFLADDSMPAENKYKTIKDKLNDNSEIADLFAKVCSGLTDYKTLSEIKLQELIKYRLKINNLDETLYDNSAAHFSKDDLFRILSSDSFGESAETILSVIGSGQNMSFSTDSDGNTVWAQYQESNKPNHSVCCVGWDDTFPASFFPEDRRPPADGALIIKNSWGDEWGMDGYFYLSYYDHSLCGVESYNILPENESRLEILEKDIMPAELFCSALFDNPVYTGNILETEIDGVPESISVLTGDLNTEYTVSLYLLDKDSAVPDDGILIDSVTGSSMFAGYHRIRLSRNTYIPAGSRVGVTVVERVNTTDGLKYSLVTTSSLGEKYLDYCKQQDPDSSQSRYMVGIVNPGESFICYEKNRWIDWSEVTGYLHNCGGDFDYIQYDNLSAKIYSYYYEDMKAKHDLTHLENMPGGQAAVCPECGYVLNILNTAA